jgi:maltooligosyltrehalose trehalohydrolase
MIEALLDPTLRPGASVTHTPQGPLTRFTVWSPLADSLSLVVSEPDSGRHALERTGPRGEWWVVEVPGLGHGTRYRYSIDGDEPVPDPASAWQPDGVHGASAVVDPTTFVWTDQGWRGLELPDTVVYELHVGTFTSEGTFDAAIAQLPRLARLGVTTIELMPVNAFAGEHNWGYDGVFPFAVQHSYGGPEGLARFVDAAHATGLAVILDVVYNHVGPEGNVLWRFGPYFTEHHHTPWGAGLNVDGPGSDGVRTYVLENVRRWIVDHHVDGFRLDAVHAVIDTSANHIWEQVATVAHDTGRAERRTVLVVSESSDNDPRYVRTPDRGGYGHDAVWNDDVHHCFRVALTGERHGYFADYQGTAAELADVIEHRWMFRGQYSVSRERSHGRPADDIASMRFVVCTRNHDQVGNQPTGARPAYDDMRKRRLAPASVLLMPCTPMLFMGEEYGEVAPFPFFVDHGDPELLEATRRGRTQEFAHADWDGDVPDPGDPATYRSAVLDPSLADHEPHRSLAAMYAEVLRLRRGTAAVASPRARQRVRHRDTLVTVERCLPGDHSSLLAINLGSERSTSDLDRGWEIRFDSNDSRWGGDGGVRLDRTELSLEPWTVALLTSPEA